MQDRRSLRLTAGVVKFGLHFVESLALFDYGFGIGLRLDSAALLVAIFAAEAEKVETSQNISQRDTIRIRFGCDSNTSGQLAHQVRPAPSQPPPPHSVRLDNSPRL